jgi:hypothetical protein
MWFHERKINDCNILVPNYVCVELEGEASFVVNVCTIHSRFSLHVLPRGLAFQPVLGGKVASQRRD